MKAKKTTGLRSVNAGTAGVLKHTDKNVLLSGGKERKSCSALQTGLCS